MVDKAEMEISHIENKILTIRNQQVMLDKDLADLYEVETKVLNQAVKRNIERFPEQFMFQLTEPRGGRQYQPYVFTEQGVAMLSAILKSKTAVKVSIQIMQAFVTMRHFIQNNAQLFTEINKMKKHQIEADKRIDALFTKMDKYKIENKQGIFFQGQIFDAYSFFQKLIQKATKEILLIDGYVDITVLDRLSKKTLVLR